MSLERTPPPATAEPLISIAPTNIDSAVPQSGMDPNQCFICAELILEAQDCLVISKCGHVFHTHCIENFLQTSSERPVCKIACQLSELRKIHICSKQTQNNKPSTRRGRGARAHNYNTRSYSRNLFTDPHTPTLHLTPRTQIEQVTPDRDNAQSYSNAFVLSPYNRTVNPVSNANVDYNLINRMIEDNVTRLLQNMNMGQNTIRHENPINRDIISGNASNTAPCQNPQRNSFSNGSNFSSLSSNPDKISSIIQNWNLKFDGSTSGLNIEEFLYRVRVLTRDTFNSDFGLICRNLNILLSGKARDWFWRYHKNVQTIIWDDFCDAIRCQYRDFKSSYDIREEIRNRKQKPGESFDIYFDAVSTIMDRLPSPMSEMELIEILIRNLRPEIRQDLLYLPVHSITHLRKLVQMRENFLNDEHVRKNLASRNNINFAPRKYVAELGNSNLADATDATAESDVSVNAIHGPISSKCWNCDGTDHNWLNCLQDRNIFCYGCGTKGVYKPNCEKCTSKRQQFSKNFKPPPPAVN